jgi:hypothetical protein
MKPISVYCKQDVHGWAKLPMELCLPKPGQEDFTCSFLNESLGLQLLTTIEDLGSLQQIRVSIAPVKYYNPELSDEEWVREIQSKAGNIIESFFGDFGFCRAPDDERRPIVKHFFHILEIDRFKPSNN